MNLDLKRALQLSFTGERWFEKVLIGILVMVGAVAMAQVPHVGGLLNLLLVSFTLGYSVRVMRQETRSAAGALPRSLPDWSDWGALLKDGILLTIANIIYGVVVVALFVGSTFLLGAGGVLAEVAAGHAVQIPGVVLLVWLFLGVVGLVVFGMFMPVMAVHYAHEDRFTACFEVPTVMRKLFANFGNLFLAVVSLIGLTVVTLLLSMTIILQPVAAFLSQVISANIWAQLYRAAGEDGK